MDNIIQKKYYKEPQNKYNLISCCVFRLKDNYKSIDNYYNGLRNLVDKIPYMFKNFYLRIYFDNSIIKPKYDSEIINKEIIKKWIPLINKLKKIDYIQLIKYEHPDFIINNGLNHKGLFGTLIRFLPLFNTNQKIKNIIITDIDINTKYLKMLKSTYIQMIGSKSQFHFNTRHCYYTSKRFVNSEKNLDVKYKPEINYRIMAGMMISKITFPFKLFNNFVNCLTNLNSDKCNYIKQFSNFKTKKYKKEYGILYYGIDEFFLNTTFLKYILKNKINFSVSIENDFIRPLWNNHYLDIIEKGISDKNLVYFYKNIMGKYYNENKSLAENYKIFDNIVYDVIYKKSDDKKKIEDLNKIFNNTKKFLNNLDKNEYFKYYFNKKEVECIKLMKDLKDVQFKLYNYDKNIGSSNNKYLDSYYRNKEKYFKSKIFK